MPQSRLLIDLENVQKSDYTLLPDDFQIMVFVGKAQTSVPIALVKMAQIWGERLELCEVSDTGKNALDMHLAFHLGRLSCTEPEDTFVILSQDKGYDPLVKHLQSLKIQCKRINSLNDLVPKLQTVIKTPEPKTIDIALNSVKPTAPIGSQYEKVYLHLKKITSKSSSRKCLPNNRESLKAHLIAAFKDEIAPNMYENIIVWLIRDKKVSEANGKLIYDFPDEDKS